MRTFLKIIGLMILFMGCINICFGQHFINGISVDTLPEQTLDSVFVNSKLRSSGASYLPEVEGTKIYAGKRTMYPGPGILPADGRTFTISLGLDI